MGPFNMAGILAEGAKLQTKEELEKWGAAHNLKLLGVAHSESDYRYAMFVGIPDEPQFEIRLILNE